MNSGVTNKNWNDVKELIKHNINSLIVAFLLVATTIISIQIFKPKSNVTPKLSLETQHLTIPLEVTDATESGVLAENTSNTTPTPTSTPTATPAPTQTPTPTATPTPTVTPQPTIGTTYNENYHPYKSRGKKLKELYRQLIGE